MEKMSRVSLGLRVPPVHIFNRVARLPADFRLRAPTLIARVFHVPRPATCAGVTMRSGPLSKQEKPIQRTFFAVLTNRRLLLIASTRVKLIGANKMIKRTKNSRRGKEN